MTLWFLFYLNILMNFPQRPNLNNIFRQILFILYSCNFYWYKLINYLNITTKIRYFDLEWLRNEISFYILFKLHMIEPIFLIQSTPELFYVTHSFLNIYAYLFIWFIYFIIGWSAETMDKSFSDGYPNSGIHLYWI